MKPKFAKLTMLSSLALAAVLPIAASAMETSAVTDLNIRSGPANNYTVVGVILLGRWLSTRAQAKNSSAHFMVDTRASIRLK